MGCPILGWDVNNPILGWDVWGDTLAKREVDSKVSVSFPFANVELDMEALDVHVELHIGER
jgi:hypothetical protein